MYKPKNRGIANETGQNLCFSKTMSSKISIFASASLLT